MTDEQRERTSTSEMAQKFWTENANKFSAVARELLPLMSRVSQYYPQEETLTQMLTETEQLNQQQVTTGQVK